MNSRPQGHRTQLVILVLLLAWLTSLAGCRGASEETSSSAAKSTAVVSELALSAERNQLTVGESLALVASVSYSDGSSSAVNDQVTWSSRNSNIATVDAGGIVTAYQSGRTTIFAELDGERARFNLTVVNDDAAELPTLQSITLASDDTSPCPAGATRQLTASALFSDASTRLINDEASWSSSDAKVATVAPGGSIHCLAAGSTVIEARLGAVGGQLTLSVQADAVTLTGISVRHAAERLRTGEKVQFSAVASYSDASSADISEQVTWSSSDEQRARVAAGGLVELLASGEVTISAATAGQRGELLITIEDLDVTLQSISIDAGNGELRSGRQLQFHATGLYSDNSSGDLSQSVSWDSSNPQVASVTTGGLVELLAPGSSTLSATLGTISGRKVLQVLSGSVRSFSIAAPAALVLAPGTNTRLRMRATYADGGSGELTSGIGWTSRQSTVATIAADGLVNALASGSTEIVASYGDAASRTALAVVDAMRLLVDARWPGSLSLTWLPQTGADAYRIYWSNSAGVDNSGNVTADLAQPPLVDFALAAGQDYYFRLATISGGVESPLGPELALPAGALANSVSRLDGVNLGSGLNDNTQLRQTLSVTDTAQHPDLAPGSAYASRTAASDSEPLRLNLELVNNSSNTTYCNIQVHGHYRGPAGDIANAVINHPLSGGVLPTAIGLHNSCLAPGQRGYVFASWSNIYGITDGVVIERIEGTITDAVSPPAMQLLAGALTTAGSINRLTVNNLGAAAVDINSYYGAVNSKFLLLDSAGVPLHWGYLSLPADATSSLIAPAGRLQLEFADNYAGSAGSVVFFFDVDASPNEAFPTQAVASP